MLYKYFIFLWCMFCSPHILLAQDYTKILGAYEDTLNNIAPSILNGKTDEVKYSANLQFKEVLKRALTFKGSYSYPFAELTTIALIQPEDKAFRIFNWNLPREDGTYEYFGFIHYFNPRFKMVQVFELTDSSEVINIPELKVLGSRNWYGAHYYKAIGLKKGKLRYYTLLGWDGHNGQTAQKIIDVLYFSSSGEPQFGLPIFETAAGYKNRLLFEYSAQAVMSVKYDTDKKLIIYDHLSSSDPRREGERQFYGPDGSYDALRLKRGKWNLYEDIDARNKKLKQKDKYNKPE